MKIWKKITAGALAVCLLMSVSVGALAAETPKGYVVLGQDLSDSQKSTVYQSFGLSSTEGYEVDYTTHAEEEEYFGDYLSADVLGSRAISSILMVPGSEGSGIQVELHNIDFCTEEMYQSALADAGVSDVKVIVAAPSAISGTCALVSAMKAYSLMSGEALDEDAKDAAVNELVTTGDVADELGSTDDAAKIVAALKDQVLTGNLDESEIGPALDKLCQEMGVTLSDSTRTAVIELMVKLKNSDIDVDALREQAGGLYQELKKQFKNVDFSDVSPETMNFLQRLINAVQEFFASIFHG